MGFGDVKFLAAIGAFLGWKAVLFTIFVSSIVGCVAGIASLVLRRQNKQAGLLPFGPFLALGALVWLLGGDALWQWYFRNF
jgi:leader peptidase (prepilin peptidase)/N-methyltransferase